MKLIVAGSRGWKDANCVWVYLYAILRINLGFDLEIVSGHCLNSPDAMAEDWATARGVPLNLFPADWPMFGRKAGPIRNEKMAQYADGLLAFWDGASKGTHNMVTLMKQRGKPYTLVVRP